MGIVQDAENVGVLLFGRCFGGSSPIFAPTRAGSRLHSITSHSKLLFLLFALLPIAVRLAILPWRPVPYPRIHDEFVHLLGAATFAEARLANAPLAFREHLESIYILQNPTYSSIYPPGIAASLALGQAFTGYYWAGVLLTTGLMCALAYWALGAWSPPPWAALGGALIVLRYGVFCSWANIYSGGSLAACGGALAFGALGRFWKRPSARAAAIAATGLSLVLFIRPFEGFVFSAATGVLLLLRDRSIRFLWPILPIAAATLCLTAIHNHAITASVTRFPYQQAQRTLGVPSNLLPLPTVPEPPGLNAQQKAMYTWQRGAYDRGRSLEGFAYAIGVKAYHFWSFYVGLPLTLALAVLLFRRWTREIKIAVAILATTFAGHVLYPLYYSAYSAHVVAVVTYLAICALARVSQFRHGTALVGLLLGADIAGRAWAFPPGYPNRDFARQSVERQLLAESGPHLVFIRYSPAHDFNDEWAYNSASPGKARIVWVREVDERSDAALMRFYQGRKVWRVEADPRPPRLTAIR